MVKIKLVYLRNNVCYLHTLTTHSNSKQHETNYFNTGWTLGDRKYKIFMQFQKYFIETSDLKQVTIIIRRQRQILFASHD